MSRTVFILHPGGLGDLLLAVPAIQGLRERFPSHEFLLCAQDEPAEFLADCGVVERWLSAQSTACAALFGGAAPDDSFLKDWLSRCDLAVAYLRNDATDLSAALKDCGAAAVVVESPFASRLSTVHQSYRFAEIVGVRMEQSSIGPLAVPDVTRTEGETYLAKLGLSQKRPLAMVHPGSGSRHKCVAPAVLQPVLAGLEANGLEPLLLEGPADHEMVERLLICLERRPNRLNGLSVRELAGVLSQVELFLGHDSGVTHLAAMLGTPTVALFGPTESARWGPRGSAVSIIQGKPCACPSWDAVRHCVEKPCLELSPAAILSACQSVRTVSVNPRIS
jgi:ADP-heptose:LPS heptosyltransferase